MSLAPTLVAGENTGVLTLSWAQSWARESVIFPANLGIDTGSSSPDVMRRRRQDSLR